jgi:hypothetical protein
MDWPLIIQLCNALGVFLGPIVVAILVNKSSERADETAVKAAKKADEVRKDLQVTSAVNTSILSVVDKVHTLVNNNMGIALKANATLSRRIADLTKDERDATAASVAERLFMEHDTKQETVDLTQKLEGKPPWESGSHSGS